MSSDNYIRYFSYTYAYGVYDDVKTKNITLSRTGRNLFCQSLNQPMLGETCQRYIA